MSSKIDAQRAEIARRYRRSHRHVGMVALRVTELQRLRRARYPKGIPDTPDGRVLVRVIVHHLAGLVGDHRRRIDGWLAEHAPWMSLGDARALMVEVATKPRRWRADRLAWRLKLISADRAALRITTIGAIDIDHRERAVSRIERKNAARTARRRAQGAKPRAEYLTTVSIGKPWIAEGISRRTWYRRRRGTGPRTA